MACNVNLPSSDPQKHQKAGSYSPVFWQLGLWFRDEVRLASKGPRTQAEASEDPGGGGTPLIHADGDMEDRRRGLSKSPTKLEPQVAPPY